MPKNLPNQTPLFGEDSHTRKDRWMIPVAGGVVAFFLLTLIVGTAARPLVSGIVDDAVEQETAELRSELDDLRDDLTPVLSITESLTPSGGMSGDDATPGDDMMGWADEIFSDDMMGKSEEDMDMSDFQSFLLLLMLLVGAMDQDAAFMDDLMDPCAMQQGADDGKWCPQ